NRDYLTALMTAAGKGFAKVAEILVANGADVNAREPVYDFTPLFLAASQGHVDVVRLLVQNGATDIQTTAGTALAMANKKGLSEIATLLKSAAPKKAASEPKTGASAMPSSGMPDLLPPQDAAQAVRRPELTDALLRQAARGETQSVRELLRMGA